MGLKEFEINNTAVEEWLAWGGITRPTVLKQKGGSCFSVIEYEPYERKILTKNLDLPKFRRGWAMWLETQNSGEKNKNYLVIFWNPFVKKNERYVENALGEKILKEKYLDYFCSEVEKIYENLSSNIGKNNGISRNNKFFNIFADGGGKRNKNAGSAVVYGRAFVARCKF